MLSGQAAVAIENARLYEAATRWSRQLESLNEIGNALATETDLERLLDLIVQRLRTLLGCRLVTMTLPGGADELRFVAAAGEGSDSLLGETLTRLGSKSGRVLERRRSERVDFVLDDPEANQEVLRRLGARTGLWVPLTVRDRTIGVLAAHDKLDSTDGRFTDDDLRLAESFAMRASLAVDLSERVARDSLARVVAAQELERRRLARELHDETGQALTSILLGLRSLEDTLDNDQSREAASGLRELVVTTLQDVRRLAVELRPSALDDFGLVPALERLTATFGEQTGIHIDFAPMLGDQRLAPDVETALYRIVQESLTNVVKHARAQRVSLVVQRRPRGVSVVIEDDGAGFDPSGLDDHGLGLVGMRERLALVGGRLAIESGRGHGTHDRRGGARHMSEGSGDPRLIVDDHAVVRSGLSLIVGSEEDLEVVGEAGNAREAIFEARSLKPDVILLDVVMPDQSGLDVLPTLLHEQPQARVLVLSMQDDPQYVRRAFAEGATRVHPEGSRRHRGGGGDP